MPGSPDWTSFYLQGLADIAARTGSLFNIVPPSAEAAAALADTPQSAMCTFEVTASASRPIRCCIDIYDNPRHVHLGLLHWCDLYFKVNLDPVIMNAEVPVPKLRQRIVRIGPGFTLQNSPRVQLALLGATLEERPFASRKFRGLLGSWSRSPSLIWLQRQRCRTLQHDVHFVVPYYSNGHGENNENRLEIMQMLSTLQGQGLRIRSGFINVPAGRAHNRFRAFATEKTSRRRYLEDVAASRIAIYVRGVNDCLSFKLGEYLALGTTVVGQPLRHACPAIDDNPLVRQQFKQLDAQAMRREILDRLAAPDRLHHMARSNAVLFDSWLSPESAAAEVLAMVAGLKLAMEPSPIDIGQGTLQPARMSMAH